METRSIPGVTHLPFWRGTGRRNGNLRQPLHPAHWSYRDLQAMDGVVI